MHRVWFSGAILGQNEIESMMAQTGASPGDSVSSGDTLVVRGESGEIEVYTRRFTDWPFEMKEVD